MASSTLQVLYLRTVCEELGCVETKWFKIGIQLGIPRSKLQEFKGECDPLSAVVDYCLKGNERDARDSFSWSVIVEALRSKYVGESGLADQISKKYCLQEIAQVEIDEPAVPVDTNLLKESSLTEENDVHQEENSISQEEDVNQVDGSNGKSATDKNSPQEDKLDSNLDSNIRLDLEFILERNLKQIIAKYASYVDCLRKAIDEREVSTKDLRSYLMSLSATSLNFKGQKLALLSDKKTELRNCESVNDIFDFLSTECTSFLNYDIFQFIVDHYKICIDSDEKLKYPDHLKAYINKHKASEFAKINPLLKVKNGSKELILKFDVETTCRLAKVDELKKSIAEIMDLNPSVLSIVNIEEGCVIVTFIIPNSVANALFMSDSALTPQQEVGLRAASVLWLKCNGYTFNFEKKEVNTEALKKVKEQLTCSICLSTYTQPKQLQCHHTYCKHCLVGIVHKDQQGQLTVACPTCRQVTPVPLSGVGGLQADFRANQLLAIVSEDNVEDIATSRVAQPSQHSGAQLALEVRKEGITQPASCPEHEGKTMDFFCETCEATICWKCIVKDGKHSTHTFEELQLVFENVKSLSLRIVGKALEKIETRSYEISCKKTAIEADIQRKTALSTEQKTELIRQLHEITQAKLKCLNDQKDQIGTFQTQLNRHLNFDRDETGQKEALGTAIKQVKRLVTEFQSIRWDPNAEADIIFSFREFQSWKVYDKSHPNPAGCYIKGYSDEARVGELCSVILQVMDFHYQPCKLTPNSIECQLKSENTSEITAGVIERKGESQYKISYQPINKGWHKLNIKVDGQNIGGSPFSFLAKLSLEKLGTQVQAIYNVIGPEGVAISDSSGGMVVAERNKHCVTLFNYNGERLLSYGTHTNPCGVALDAEDNVFTTDKETNCVQKFALDGEFITLVGTQTNGPLQFDSIYGIAVSPCDGKVYVSDEGNCQIYILDSDLSYCDSFGGIGSGKGLLDHPQHLACDDTGNVYVADRENHRIQVFTAKGEFLRMFGRRGEDKWSLKYPCGVAIDANSRVYVSELSNHRISVFTSKGQFVTSYNENLNFPRGLAMDSNQILHVCDFGNNRIPQLLFP